MHFIFVCRLLDIFYCLKIKCLQDRSLLIGFFIGLCVSQIYTFRFEIKTLVPRILYENNNIAVDTVNKFAYEPHVIKYNKTNENRLIADKLYKEVKVLCWVMTQPKNHQEKAIHIKNTWGKRCNKLLFMSSEADENLGIIALPVKEGRKHLWSKTKEAFKYIYNNHLNEYDWFLKADDDTYVVVENLRYLLYPYDPLSGLYFGCKFQPNLRKIYMSGGAGYVLSKEAVKRFVEYGLKYPQYCQANLPAASEDVKMGQCMRSLGIILENSRDINKHSRFFPLSPIFHVSASYKGKFWYWEYIKYNSDLDCCSDYTISFHYIEPQYLYVLDYLIYHLKPFGIQIIENLPEKIKSINTKVFKKLHLNFTDNTV